MPTTRTFPFVFRGKQVEVEREYASDEEELINTKPRCLWPDDGRNYGEKDDYYEEEQQQWDKHEQHEDHAEAGPSVQHHYNEHNQLGTEQQDAPQTPPPVSPTSPSRPQSNYQLNAYEEEYDPLPEQPTINRGYIAEAVTMVQHPPRSAIARQNAGFRDYRDYTDEEDAQNIGQDDTMYTDFYDGIDSDEEERSPLCSQEITINPFEHIPDPEKDWILAQERERQRIASKDKLGIPSQDDKEERTLASTVVTRPAQPDEIQALYAAILGRRKVPEKEQEEQLGFQIAALSTGQHSTTGGSGSSLYGSGSEDEQGPEEKSEVMEAYNEEVTLTVEGLLQKKLAELGPCNPGRKHCFPLTDECAVEDQAEDNDEDEQTDATLVQNEATLFQTDATLIHKCKVFDGVCWINGQRELLVGVYWFHKGERSLRSVHRRFDKFQVMSYPDDDNNDNSARAALHRTTGRKNASEPTSPILSLDAEGPYSGYLSS
ncbi:hypothetical protein BGW39_003298 [Mortierella sp. 14UC]|nr:hypothetical protein BGW39_003298 [Mortierella sp. 14UC]